MSYNVCKDCGGANGVVNMTIYTCHCRKVFPTLFQKTTTGAIQQWRIWVVEMQLAGTVGAVVSGVIYTEHGQVGGKLQKTHDILREGKNPGKSNETTALQQAIKEAEAKWTKQKKKGYVEAIDDAQADKVDAIIEGGIEPMLAPNKSYPKDDELVNRIVYPCYFQPKLDGMRDVAIIENGKCEMWSRTRKRVNTVPHIIAALEKAFPTGRVVLDGELYNHKLKDRFEDLISILRDEKSALGLRETDVSEGGHGLTHLDAEYHVYDCIEQNVLPQVTTMATPFGVRNQAVDGLFGIIADSSPYLARVHTQQVSDLEALKVCYEAALADGYEGGMARNAEAPYEAGRRSKHLQKMKEFQDAEFRITGAEEGRGKDAGTIGAFSCATGDGKEFRCRLKATYARRRELFASPEQWRGKFITVTFKRWTADKVPYLPIGKGIRDYE